MRRKKVAVKKLDRPIWIHAASGEFEYAKAVIRELKVHYPNLPIMVTYFSPSFERQVNTFPGVDLALPLPLDLAGPVVSFIRKYKPRVLLISRTDFWPEVLLQCKRHGIPAMVFAYTQKPVNGIINRFYYRWRLSMLSHIFTVSPEDEGKVRELVKIPIQAIGDTRYDQVRYRLDHPQKIERKYYPPETGYCLVAGSTWPEDEKILVEALEPFLNAGRLRLIVVPHEPTPKHLRRLESSLKRARLKFARYSEFTEWEDDSVLVVDVVGRLAELYQLGNLAFVGGSFRRGVHSVMEPLGAGLITIVGPKHLNNREAVEFSHVLIDDLPLVLTVKSASDCRDKLEVLLAKDLSHLSREISLQFSLKQGASQRLLKAVAQTNPDLFFPGQ